MHTSAWWCHIVIWWAQFVHIVGTKPIVGWPILCFYAFPGSIIPPLGSQGTSIGFGCTGGREDEAYTCFVRFLSWSCLSADHQKPLATAWGGSVELPSMFIGSVVWCRDFGTPVGGFLVGSARFVFLRVGHVSAPCGCTNPTYHPLVHGF